MDSGLGSVVVSSMRGTPYVSMFQSSYHGVRAHRAGTYRGASVSFAHFSGNGSQRVRVTITNKPQLGCGFFLHDRQPRRGWLSVYLFHDEHEHIIDNKHTKKCNEHACDHISGVMHPNGHPSNGDKQCDTPQESRGPAVEIHEYCRYRRNEQDVIGGESVIGGMRNKRNELQDDEWSGVVVEMTRDDRSTKDHRQCDQPKKEKSAALRRAQFKKRKKGDYE